MVDTAQCSLAEAMRLIQHHGSGNPMNNVVFCDPERTSHSNDSNLSRISIPVLFSPTRSSDAAKTQPATNPATNCTRQSARTPCSLCILTLLARIVLFVLIRGPFLARTRHSVLVCHRNGLEDAEELDTRSEVILADRYQVGGLLGQGAFGRTFRCFDLERNRNVCVKIVNNSKAAFDGGLGEIKVLSQLTQRWRESNGNDEPPFIQMLDYVYFREHLLIVTELLGDSLGRHLRFKRIETTGGCFSPAVQAAQITQLLEALDFMHDLGIAHCDVKPDNICIKNDDPSVIKLIDYNSCVFREDALCSYMQSRWYRAPEVMLGMPELDAKKMDMWSTACTALQLHLGYPVFEGASIAAVLAAQQAVLGPYPNAFLQACDVRIHPMYFTPEDELYEILPAQHPYEAPVVNKLTPISNPLLAQLLSAADPLMLDLLTSMLQYAPGARPSAREALAHPFIAKYKRGEQGNESAIDDAYAS